MTYRQLAVFTFLIATLLFNGYSPSITWVYMVPILAVNYLMILALSMLAAAIVTVVRDFNPLISLGMIFMMFTSGIFWDVRSLNDPAKTELLLNLNPLAFVLDAYRQVLMYNTPPDMFHLLSIGAGFGALLCLAVLLLRRTGQFLALKALTV